MTPFPDIAFINEEATDCIIEKTIGAVNNSNEATIAPIIVLTSSPSCFFYFMFLCSSSTIN